MGVVIILLLLAALLLAAIAAGVAVIVGDLPPSKKKMEALRQQAVQAQAAQIEYQVQVALEVKKRLAAE